MSNKEKLLEQAAFLMADKGYAGATMDMVLESTGIAKSNAYYHYATKEELGQGVLRFWITQFEQLDKIALLNQSFSRLNCWNSYQNRLIRFQETLDYPGNTIAAITHEMNTADANTLYRQHIRAHHQALKMCIEGGQLHSEFNTILNPDAAAWIIADSISGALTTTRALQSTIPLQELFAQLTSLLVS